MKYITRLVLFFGVLIFLFACSPTSKLTMGVKQPAKIPIPSNISRIGLINRSIPSEANKSVDKIDKLLSLEGLKLDEKGSYSALQGLKTELKRNGRFESVTIIDSLESIREGLGIFPVQLNWDDIDVICETYNLDIIFSLEYYNTNSTVQYDQKMVNIPNPLGVNVNVPSHKVTIQTALENGWRIYDPQSKYVLDKTSYKDNITSIGEGINPLKAVKAIAGRKEAVLQSSNNIGIKYGTNIRSLMKRVSRDYFVKGTNNFEIGQRRAKTGDWNGAAELWEKELNNANPKIAGRAYYNTALINEINGNLDKAIEYASKAYADYENKNALKYLNILKHRKSQVHQINEQLSK